MGRWGKAWAALALAGALAACGGGGGGGGGGGAPAVVPPTVVPPTVVPPAACTSAHILNGSLQGCINPATQAQLPSAADSLTEWSSDYGFNTQPALAVIKAHYAYGTANNSGFNGAGVTLAFLADGMDTSLKAALHYENGASRVTRIHQIAFAPDANYLDSNVLVGDSTITANAAVTTDCGSRDNFRTCWGTELAALAVGKSTNATVRASLIAAGTLGVNQTLANVFAEAWSVRGVAPGAKPLDIPSDALWEAYCSRTGPSCTGSKREDAEAYASVLGASMNAALAYTDKPRYVQVLRSYPALSDVLYFPTYGEGEAPSGTNLEYYQRLVQALGTPVWQGGPPASGADTRSVFVMPAGNDYELGSGSKVCGNWNLDASGPNAEKTCGPADANLAADPRLFGMLPRMAELVGSTGVPMGSDLKDTFLVVVALSDTADGNGDYPIYGKSNRCGRAAAWCMAAPGRSLKSYGTRSSPYSRKDGTEYAAALVMGALALVDSAFNAEGDMVSPAAVRKRLLDTADKAGLYADSSTYGHGLLDIEAALGPVGSSSMPAGTSASFGPLGLVGSAHAPGLPLHGLGLALPGQALAMLGETRVMALDSQGFPFFVQLRDLAHAPQAQAPLFADMAASTMAQGPAAMVPIASGLLDISAGMGSGGTWGSALTPKHLVQGGQGGQTGHAGHLTAGSHLAVSPLMATSLESDNTGHVAVRANFGQQSIAAMACTQRHTQRGQDSVQGNGAHDCMALGWDWNAGDSFGLSVRAHALDSRGGLYRYGARCFGGACAGGGATATELGLGGFAKLSGGLRLGWNWWHGWADDLDGGSDLVRYAGLGHSAGSLALESANGVWSLYVQQPLRAEGSLQLVLPERRDPAGNVHFARHHLRLDGAARPLRLGLSSRLALTRRGGYMALDLGAERGMHGYAGTHPYLAVQTSIPW